MSTTPATARRPSAFGRYLFVFLLGAALGAIGLVMALNAWNARQDHFPDSVMNVQQWHLGQLSQAVERNRCGATDTLPHLQALRTMANDLEPAFPGLADDARYIKHASGMRATLDAALSSPPINCAGVASLAEQVGNGCKGCHQDFR